MKTVSFLAETPMKLPSAWCGWSCRTLADTYGKMVLELTGGHQFDRGLRLHHRSLENRALPSSIGLSNEQSDNYGYRNYLTFPGRTKLSTSCAASSSGRGGAQLDSGGEFAGSFGKKWLAFQEWTRPGWGRSLSQDVKRREDDEGDWRYSPEWWGTQNGGWGHNQGETVFEAPSSMGNGVVSVTSHPASKRETHRKTESFLNSPMYEVLDCEWRVLRFNTVTRQSVAKVTSIGKISGDIILFQQPNCIAFEYIKSMLSSGLAAVSLAGLNLKPIWKGYEQMHILCIGMGGGSLPLFLAHNLSGATVDVVEIDGTVIAAAIELMGFPPSYPTNSKKGDTECNPGVTLDEKVLWGGILPRVLVHEDDGQDFVCRQAQKLIAKKDLSRYDLVFVDAYDGHDVVPPQLWDRSGPFLQSLSYLLNPDHGTVVVNLHTDSAPPNLLERISGNFGPGFDPTLPQGKRVHEAALAYRDVLLRKADPEQFMEDSLDPTETEGLDRTKTGSLDRTKTGSLDPTNTDRRGVAFTVAVSLQGNVSLVVSRGVSVDLETESSETITDKKVIRESDLAESFVAEAEKVQSLLQTPFDMSKRVSRGFQIVKSRDEF